jgi:predicted transcriptional regulator
MRKVSKIALKKAKENGSYYTTKKRILKCLKQGKATRQMLAVQLNKTINCITQPVCDLLNEGTIKETKTTNRCKVTKSKAHYLLLNDKPLFSETGEQINHKGQILLF